MNNWYGVAELTRLHHADLEGEARRDGLARAAHAAGAGHPSLPARLGAALLTIVRRDRRPDHSLTDYPCRLPDGSIGRVAVVRRQGDWTLVCRVA